MTGRTYADALVAVLRYEQGADPTPAELGVEMTPGQAWHALLHMPAVERLERLGRLLEDSRRGYNCVLFGHEAQREDLHRAHLRLGDLDARLRQAHAWIMARSCEDRARLDTRPLIAGSWVTYWYNNGPEIVGVFATELDALRTLNGAGVAADYCTFLPHGADLADVVSR